MKPTTTGPLHCELRWVVGVEDGVEIRVNCQDYVVNVEIRRIPGPAGST